MWCTPGVSLMMTGELMMTGVAVLERQGQSVPPWALCCAASVHQLRASQQPMQS
jgi:hypothetical protein